MATEPKIPTVGAIVTFASKSYCAPNATRGRASGVRNLAAIAIGTGQFMLSLGPTDPRSDARDHRPSCGNKMSHACFNEGAPISRCDVSRFHALIGPLTMNLLVNGSKLEPSVSALDSRWGCDVVTG